MSLKSYNNNATGNGNEEKELKPLFKVSKGDPFPQTIEGTTTTTTELKKDIVEMFSKVFADFYGVTIDVVTPNPAQPMSVQAPSNLMIKLYFKAGTYPEDATRAFTTVDEASKQGGLMTTLNSFSMKQRGNVFVMTEEGERGLTQFMPRQVLDKNGRISKQRWENSFLSEESEKAPNGAITTYKVVSFIDILEVFKNKYGVKNEKGHYVQYRAIPTRPQMMQAPGQFADAFAGASTPFGAVNGSSRSAWIVEMSRIDMSDVQAIAAANGLVSAGGTLNIYTGK